MNQDDIVAEETEDADMVEAGIKSEVEKNTENEESDCDEMNAEDSGDYQFECLYCDFTTTNQRQWTTHVNYLHQSPEISITDEEANLASEKTLKSEEIEVKSEEIELKSEEIELKSEEIELESEEIDLKSEEIELKSEAIELKSEEIELKSEEIEFDLHEEIDLDEDNKLTCIKNANEVEFDQSEKNSTEEVADWAEMNVEESEETEDATSSKSSVNLCCEHCSYKCVSKQRMTQHVLLKHTDSKQAKWFHCDKCSFIGKTRAFLYHHVKRMHPKRTAEAEWQVCKHCSFKTKFEKSLERHMDAKHKENELFKCDECSFKTKFKRKLLSHKTSHVPQKEWLKCELCEYKCKTTVLYDRHYLLNHTADGDILSLWYKCKLCPYQNNMRDYLRRHVSKIHRLSKSDINSHIIPGRKLKEVDYEEHKSFKVGTKDNDVKFFCCFCDYLAVSYGKILQHISFHHNMVTIVPL